MGAFLPFHGPDHEYLHPLFATSKRSCTSTHLLVTERMEELKKAHKF
jgi:hypothetical protein